MQYQTMQAFVIFHSFRGSYPFYLFSRLTVEIGFLPYDEWITHVLEKLAPEPCSSSLQFSKEFEELSW